MRLSVALLFTSALVGSAAGVAAAGPVFSFSRATSNASQNVASQFTMEVDSFTAPNGWAGNPLVSFRFTNTGSVASSISEIYFEDGTLFKPYTQSILQTTSNFVQGGPNPANPPGVSPFSATKDFSADAVGNPSNGLNPGQYATFVFELENGKVFADTIQALLDGFDGRDYVDPNNTALGFSSLRVALHARAIGDASQSDSFVATTLVPLPPAAWAGLSTLAGVGLVGLIRRRKNASQ